MSELSGPILGQAEDDEDGETFPHPPEGEQERSAESDETLGPDEKSG